jgi:hypothetical protein
MIFKSILEEYLSIKLVLMTLIMRSLFQDGESRMEPNFGLVETLGAVIGEKEAFSE